MDTAGGFERRPADLRRQHVGFSTSFWAFAAVASAPLNIERRATTHLSRPAPAISVRSVCTADTES
jgi:hypothetical protein